MERRHDQKTRRKHSAGFKAKSGTCGDSRQQKPSELGRRFDGYPNQITACKRQLSEGVSGIFDKFPARPDVNLKALHAKIGAITRENYHAVDVWEEACSHYGRPEINQHWPGQSVCGA